MILNINMAEVVYDVENKTFLTGRAHSDGRNHEQVAMMQLNEDEENRNQVIRSLSSATGEVRVLLAPYAMNVEDIADNTLKENLAESVMHITVTLPANMNMQSIVGLPDAIHDYLVQRTVADWFKITHKSGCSEYEKLSEVTADKIRRMMSCRLPPHRPDKSE